MKILKKICLALSFLFFSQTVLSLRTLEMIKISQLEDIKRISPFFFQTMLKWRMDVLPCVVMRFAGNVHAPCVNTITSPSLCHLQSDGDHWTISYTKQWESPREHYTTQHLFIVWFSSKKQYWIERLMQCGGGRQTRKPNLFSLYLSDISPDAIWPLVLTHIMLTSSSVCWRPMHVRFSIFSFQKKKNNNGFSYSPHISV